MDKFQNDFVKAFLKVEIDQDRIGTFTAQEVDAIKKYGKFLDENLTFDSGEWKTITEALSDTRGFYGRDRAEK